MSIYKRAENLPPPITRYVTVEELGLLLDKKLIQKEDFVIGFDDIRSRFIVVDPEGVFYFVAKEAFDG